MGANYNPKSLEAIMPHCFKPGQSGNPKGRPKSRVEGYLKKLLSKRAAARKYAMSVREVDEWETKLLVCTASELKLIAMDENAPAYAKNIAVALLTDMKNGTCRTASQLRERQYGGTKQTLEITGANGAPLVETPMLTPTEAKKFLEDFKNSI